MAQSTDAHTTIPTPPTIAEMEAMWLAARQDDADRAAYARTQRRNAAIYLERAAEDDALYGEAA